jgi:hypothetical protein
VATRPYVHATQQPDVSPAIAAAWEAGNAVPANGRTASTTKQYGRADLAHHALRHLPQLVAQRSRSGSASRPIQPYPASFGDPNDADHDGVACEYGCKN